MFKYFLFTFLISFSPLGEARAGIPYGVIKGIPIIPAFIVGLVANLLVFPVFYWLMRYINQRFWHNRKYRRRAVWMTQRAKRNTKKVIQKYGFLGLMVFVMIPLPGTGAYVGTISAIVFGIEKKKAFYAVSLGVTISCIIVALISFFTDKAVN